MGTIAFASPSIISVGTVSFLRRCRLSVMPHGLTHASARAVLTVGGARHEVVVTVAHHTHDFCGQRFVQQF